MPRVVFTPNLQRHVACPPAEVAGTTAVFVDGEQLADRTRLSDPVRADGEVYVMQALSGG
jgi:hypothetical protein